MKVRAIVFWFLFLSLGISLATAQASKPATATHPAAAAAAQKQFAAALADYRANPGDTSLRGKVIDLAKTLKPAPAVPLAVRTQYAAAVTQLGRASTADEYKAAAGGFEQVAAQAPWWAEAWLKAATAYSKANDLDNAKRTLAVYREAVRPGVDTSVADTLQQQIDEQQAAAQQRQAQQQFQQALQAFQSNPTDSARAQVIKLAQTMQPPPAIPQAAREDYVMATTFIESAKDNSGYEHAIEHYEAALAGAPWWADTYKKLAIAQKAAAHYDDAMATLNLYLLTQPADAQDAQDEISKLKALKQAAAEQQARDAESQREQAARERQERLEQKLRSLDGAQFKTVMHDICSQHTQTIEITGNSVIWTRMLEDVPLPVESGERQLG